MSTDERMKLYKEKFGGAKSDVQKKTGGSAKKNASSYKKRSNSAPAKRAAPKHSPVSGKTAASVKKAGLFSKIKSLFGGKNK